MKENVLDVLMYLFETYVDTDEEPEADQNELRDELAEHGRCAMKHVDVEAAQGGGELRQTAAASRELLSEETIPLHDGRLVAPGLP